MVPLRLERRVGRTNSWTEGIKDYTISFTFFLFVSGSSVGLVKHSGGFEEFLNGVGVGLI